MTAPDHDPLAPREKTPAVSFAGSRPGDRHRLRVLEYTSEAQARDYQTKQPKYWPNRATGQPDLSQPMMVPVIKVAYMGGQLNGQPLPPTGEVQTLWGEGVPMKQAMVDGQARRPGGGRITPGDILDVIHTEDKPDPQNPSKNPQKIYRIDVTPGDPLAQQNGQQAPPSPGLAQPLQTAYPPQPLPQPAYQQQGYQQAPLPPYEASQPQQQPSRQPAGFTQDPPF